ncbi:MAG: hypothetical protein V4678_02370 [Patescibacteria group bacterium]
MSELSIPSSPLLPLRERLPAYAAHLDRLNVRHERWEAQREKTIGIRIRRELGMISVLSGQTGRIESERNIISYEGHGIGTRTEHLAWDLGLELPVESPDQYSPSLYLARSNHHFYRGDPGKAMPHTPEASFDLLRRVRDVRFQLEQ